MIEDKPWYASSTIWGALIAVAASLGGLIGINLSAQDQAALTEIALQLASVGGALLAIYGRLRADRRIG